MTVYRPVAWLVFLIGSLVLFLAWMPYQMRMFIWHALVARGLLSSMLLVFSLLAVSLSVVHGPALGRLGFPVL